MAMNTALLLGKETAGYGVAGTLTRAYEVEAPSVTLQRREIPRTGRRAGQQGPRPSKYVNTGADVQFGAIDFLNAGMGQLLELMFPSVTGPVQQGGSTAYLVTAQTGVVASTVSHTVQTQLEKASLSTVTPFNYLGAMATGWTLSHAVDGNLQLTLPLDCQSAHRYNSAVADGPTNVPAATPVYVDGLPFNWGQLAVTFTPDGEAVGSNRCVKDIEITHTAGLQTARDCMDGNGFLKKQPRRAAVPTLGGTMNVEYEADDMYDVFHAGTEGAIVATWTGDVIEAGYNHELTLTIPRVQISGDTTPTNPIDDTPMQPIPFTAVHDGEATALATLTVQSADTAL